MAEAKKANDLGAAMDQLQNALEQSKHRVGRCWAILFHGLKFLLYEYHKYLPWWIVLSVVGVSGDEDCPRGGWNQRYHCPTTVPTVFGQ